MNQRRKLPTRVSAELSQVMAKNKIEEELDLIWSDAMNHEKSLQYISGGRAFIFKSRTFSNILFKTIRPGSHNSSISPSFSELQSGIASRYEKACAVARALKEIV